MGTQAKAERFEQLVGLLDSPHAGEAHAALDVVLRHRGEHNWLNFADLLRTAVNSIPPEKLAALETERDQARQLKAVADRRVVVLLTAVAALKTTLAATRSWTRIAIVAAGIALCGTGYRCLHSAAAAPVADRNAFQPVLAHLRWQPGDTAPAVMTIAGQDFWIIARGSIDNTTHRDAHGHSVERYCIDLFALPAERDGRSYLTPRFFFAFRTFSTWRVAASDCRT